MDGAYSEIMYLLFAFLADRTNGRAIGTVLRLSSSSVVCLWRYVLWLNAETVRPRAKVTIESL